MVEVTNKPEIITINVIDAIHRLSGHGPVTFYRHACTSEMTVTVATKADELSSTKQPIPGREASPHPFLLCLVDLLEQVKRPW